jgi:hypothetical protein
MWLSLSINQFSPTFILNSVYPDVCMYVCMYVYSIMAVHPWGMGRYEELAKYIVAKVLAPVQRPTMRAAYPLLNAMLKVYPDNPMAGAGRPPSLLV